MNGPALRDIHVPSAGWWPLAPGWWGVAVLLVIVLLGGAWVFVRHHRHGVLRATLREIDAIKQCYANDADVARVMDSASQLMRRIARRIEPRVASQSGDSWRAFVHRYARDVATRDSLDDLMNARFRAAPTVDVPALLDAMRAWCEDALRRVGSSTRVGHTAP